MSVISDISEKDRLQTLNGGPEYSGGWLTTVGRKRVREVDMEMICWREKF